MSKPEAITLVVRKSDSDGDVFQLSKRFDRHTTDIEKFDNTPDAINAFLNATSIKVAKEEQASVAEVIKPVIEQDLKKPETAPNPDAKKDEEEKPNDSTESTQKAKTEESKTETGDASTKDDSNDAGSNTSTDLDVDKEFEANKKAVIDYLDSITEEGKEYEKSKCSARHLNGKLGLRLKQKDIDKMLG